MRNFLRANPSFLEDYVMKHVNQDRLERWLIRKTRKLKNKGSKKNINSVEHNNNKQSGKKTNIFRPSLTKSEFLAVLSWKLFYSFIHRSTPSFAVEMEGT